MKYYDKNGEEILAGATIRYDDGKTDHIYSIPCDGKYKELGVNASNEDYLRNYYNNDSIMMEYGREYYPLTEFPHKVSRSNNTITMVEMEIIEPEDNKKETVLAPTKVCELSQ